MSAIVTRLKGAVQVIREKTRQFGPLIAFSIAGGTYLVSCLPHTSHLDKIEWLIQYRSRGKPKELSTEEREIVSEVKKDLCKKGFSEAALNKVKVIYQDYFAGYEPWVFGSLNSKRGVLIGYPICLSFDNFEEIIVTHIGPLEVDSDSEEADDLAKTYILNENSKKFLLAREIYLADSNYFHVKAGFLSSAVLLSYLTGKGLNEFLFGFQRRLSLLYLGILPFILYINVSLFDRYTFNREIAANQAVANISKDYAEGGLHLYTQTIARNKMFRHLMGPYKEKIFTVGGNRKYMFWRTSHVPFTKCRDDLDLLVATKYESKS
ncbi:hypothetical protein FSP39_014359 [Pinctada imbricata]|uniref:Transmembrane protein 177 n=1 Tax=Pinctada imbricata TaxID=66713 RepID=A0AA88Y3T7_PINIB|nr:hypothetical protein FSP39_014359 [Pinctada imbricata]